MFFNTTPAVCGPVIGVTAAMEEARANGAEIDDGTINGIKVGLMGPLAGGWRSTGLGNAAPDYRCARRISGTFWQHPRPAFFFFIFNAVRLAMKWYGLQLGFRKGVNIVSDMGGNVLQKLTEGASILGLFVMGVLVTKWDVNQRTVGGFTNACRRWLHRHHDRAEHSRPTLPWFAGARSDAAYGSSAQQKKLTRYG